MFMFRTRRNSLGKRLWKARVDKENEANSTAKVKDREEEMALKNAAQALFQRLQEPQLELLVRAVESKGASAKDCVLLHQGELRVGRRTFEPHVLCCQIWRWTDVRQAFELRRLSYCGSAKDPVYICCNPYHWSRLCKPESPPPPYSRFAVERLKPEDRAPSEPVSQETGGSLQYGSVTGDGEVRRPWCNLAYWELKTRVGRLYPVTKAAVNVFSTLLQGEGFSLAALVGHQATTPPCEAVKRTREKIGLGLTLSQEADGVWMYNRSDCPLFVNSPTLDLYPSRTLLVYRVSPGYSLKIFDYDKAVAVRNRREKDGDFPDGPFDPNSVRISFAKGWGPKYSRQHITCCPCWIEVLLAPCR